MQSGLIRSICTVGSPEALWKMSTFGEMMKGIRIQCCPREIFFVYDLLGGCLKHERLFYFLSYLNVVMY